MLKKKYRLRKDSAFSATFRIKNLKSDEFLILYKGKLKTSDIPTKAGFVVSKKIHKRAVKRNRIKRLLREAYDFLLKNNEINSLQNSLSLVFIAKSSCIGISLDTVKNSIRHLAQKF